MNSINNIEEMIDSSDIECKYLAVSMLKYGEVKMSKTKKDKLIKKVNIIDRIRNLNDVYSELNIKEEDVLIFKEPKNKFERYINACSIIPKIVECFNEGEILDWTNINQYKYLPYFKKNIGFGSGWSFRADSSWSDYSCGSASYHYKSSELCKDACIKFTNIYNDFYDYKG